MFLFSFACAKYQSNKIMERRNGIMEFAKKSYISRHNYDEAPFYKTLLFHVQNLKMKLKNINMKMQKKKTWLYT